MQDNKVRNLIASVAVLMVVLLGRPAVACLWDSDTLADEAKGIPEVVDVVTGWFDRNPPAYYEMRLARVTALIEKDPNDLNAYDDAGVACDRLGRDDEAIAWMDRKLQALGRLPAGDPKAAEHRYHYLANVGTFWVHRWARQGADRTKIDQVKKARDYIAEAIKLNPDAHFGREKYQLMALEWIIDPSPFGADGLAPDGPATQPQTQAAGVSGFLPDFLGLAAVRYRAADPGHALARQLRSADSEQTRQILDSAAKGLSGLVVLGGAWESVDVYYALGLVVSREGKANVAHLIQLRIGELVGAGHGSLLQGEPQGDELTQTMTHAINYYMPKDTDSLDRFYTAARAAAEARNQARTAFMQARLTLGRHPDTDAHFWDGYVEPARVPMPGPTLFDRMIGGRRHRDDVVPFAIFALGCGGLIGAVVLRAVLRSRARRRAVQGGIAKA